MKTTCVICAMLLTLVSPALLSGQGGTKSKAPQAGGVERQLKQMEDDWQNALKNKDGATLKRIIAEDWAATDDKGKVLNRDAYISQTTSNTDVSESNENFDMQVRVYGDTAVVTGGSKEKGTRGGTPYTDTYRWTDVFVKRGGSWLAVASQWMKVP
jgi:ketosteroid isomerase-like protein